MIRQMETPEAHARLYNMAMRIAEHLGHAPNFNNTWIHSMESEYNPLRDPDVLDFMDVASSNEIQAESQQVAALDELDRNMP